MVYDLIASNELYELLNVSKASLIVSSMWDGKYETHSFLNYSLNYQIVKSIIFRQKNLIGYSPDYVDEMSISETYKKLKKKFNTRKERKYVKPVKAHFFMFKAWKKSMSIRYVIDAVFIIIVGIVLQIQMNTLQETASDWYVIYPVYWERHTRLQNSSLTVTERVEAQKLFIEVENEYLRIGNKAYGELMGIYITMAIMMAYSFRNICQIIYAKLRKRTWESIYGEFALSICHLFITIVVLYRYLTDHRYRTNEDPRYNDLEVIYTAYYRESFLDMTLVLGLYIAIQWARVVLIFRVNSFIGPLLNIIYSMLKEILKFIAIYLLMVLVFASSGRLFFITIDEFSTDSQSWLTLFSASIGSFSFEMFDSPKMVLSPSYGYYFLMAYLVITNVVLLNFIIAILSNTYSKLKDLSKALYYNEVLKVRNIFEYDKHYSSMVSLFIPLNIILLPVIPFVIIMKSKKLNTFLLHIAFLPVMFIGTLIFIVTSIVLYPISYFALLYQNFIDIWEKGETTRDKWVEAGQFFEMIFKAPFMLLGNIVADTYKFVTSLYTKKLKINNERAYSKLNDVSKVDARYFELLRKILYKSRNKLVDMKKVIRELGDELEIQKHVRNIVYFSHKYNADLDEHKEDFDSSEESKDGTDKNRTLLIKNDSTMHIIKQYNL